MKSVLRSRWVRASALVLSVVLIGGACTPPDGGGGSTPVDNTQQFCALWDQVAESPQMENAALVKDGVVAKAEDTARAVGESCTAAAARVDMDDALVAEGEEIPSEKDNPDSDPIAAITGDELSAGQPVLDNLWLSALNAEIGPKGITLRGNVSVRLSGVTSTIGFVGTLSNLENWSITLSSSALTIPGISSTPVVFSGTLKSVNGVPSLSMSASATQAKIGDITVNSAQINFFASPAAGVSASVTGSIAVGPSTVSGTVNVAFDRAGSIISAKVDLAAHLVGTQADGKKIDLEGTVTLDGNAEETVASFTAHGNVGDFIIHEANGTLTLEHKKATLVGVFDVEQGANTVRFNGAIVWDNGTAYTPYFNLEGAGEISGTLNDGQNVKVSGTLEAEMIGGQLRSVITGNFQIGTLKANGTAIVETNGATTNLTVDADLVGAGFAGHIEGAVVITDGLTELVNLDASVTGTVKIGDVTVNNATFSVRSTYGNPLDITFSGAFKVGTKADLSGTVNASIGPNGTLLSLRGDIQGSLALDSWAVANFNGSIVATIDQVTVTGAGDIVLNNFPAGLKLNGSLTSSLTHPSWSLTGSARFRIGPIDIASARINLSQLDGMRATRVGFYFSIIGIPTYFEGNFYMKPSGGCDKVDITGGGLIAKLILVTVLPGAIGCPVNI